MRKRKLLLSALLAIAAIGTITCNHASALNKMERTLPHTDYYFGDTVGVSVIGHASLYLTYQRTTIAVDPYSAQADYAKLPAADIILITHEHADHYDPKALREVTRPFTVFVAPPRVAKLLEQDGFGDHTIITLGNGDNTLMNPDLKHISIEAVPAYNTLRLKPDGEPYHPAGYGNGYMVTLGTHRIYIAGDTEQTPEMAAMAGTIDIAFLPKNLPYTMTDAEFVAAAKALKPKVLYPYHFFDIDREALRRALDGEGIIVK